MLGWDDAINGALQLANKFIADPREQAKFQMELEKIRIQRETDKDINETNRLKTEQEDRSSARTMQGEALKQDDLFSKRFIYYFTIFWSIASVIYVACITFMEIPISNVRFADTILGFILGTAVAQMFGFFYGSSSSGRTKDVTIATLAKNV